MGEYMAMGKPVLALDLKESRRTAEDAAQFVELSNIPAFGDARAALMDDPARRQRMGERGRQRNPFGVLCLTLTPKTHRMGEGTYEARHLSSEPDECAIRQHGDQPFTPLLLTLCTNHFWNIRKVINTGMVTIAA
jgi:hypothetical protein